MPERSDDDLVRDYLGGDMEAFEALYGRYRARLFGLVRSMGLRPSETEDLFQETWLRAIRGMGRYRPRGRFRFWLFTIARNAYLDRVRRDGREVPIRDAEDEPAVAMASRIPRPDETLSERERMDRLQQAAGALPPGERAVLQLRVREEMSFREIGEVLDIPVGTALWRMHRAVRRLAEALAGDDSAEGAVKGETGEKKRD
jgi:RNA polymerase sigma-70 factor (ECF subfamily)